MSRHALDRAVLLAAASRPDWPADAIADLPLGAISTSLLRMRRANFGSHIDAHADCRHCGERLSVTLDVADLLRDAPAETIAPPAPATTELTGLCLRTPSLRDLAAVADLAPEDAADVLLQRCLLDGHAAELDMTARARIGEALEALDPQADLVLRLQCVRCGQEDMAQLDIATLLWDEVTARAGGLLQEIHRLASAYGWSEEQILSLSTVRRAHYLSLVEAAS